MTNRKTLYLYLAKTIVDYFLIKDCARVIITDARKYILDELKESDLPEPTWEDFRDARTVIGLGVERSGDKLVYVWPSGKTAKIVREKINDLIREAKNAGE